MSTFGTLFRVTTFGESHCKGVPPCMPLTEADIQPQLTRRRPGQSRLTTPRSETDTVTILSGTERGVTLGTPIGLFVPNENVRPGDYSEMDTVPRPGHADYTYQMKYGTRASSGGGRSSARETIGRVAAGAIAEAFLAREYGTRIVTLVSAVGTVELPPDRLYRGDGTPWSREEVDTHGTLTLLRDAYATGWKLLPTPAGGPSTADAKAAKAAQDALDAADEEAFLAAYNGTSNDVQRQMELGRQCAPSATAAGGVDAAAATSSSSSSSSSAHRGYAFPGSVPCYEAWDGALFDMHGVRVAQPPPGYDVAAARTNEVFALRCPDPATAARMASLIRSVKGAQDSTGGVLTTIVTGVPIGLGEPVFDKAEALLAHAMLSLPATKGFEIGSGFGGTRLRGSVHNDAFVGTSTGSSSSASGSGAGASAGATALLATATNNAGGTLGGITNGADLVFRVPIKPVSTIGRAQVTATYSGEEAVLEAKGRHDPCVLPRAPPLVEAMTALVLADLALIQRSRSGGPLSVLPSSAQDSGALAGQKRKHGDE